MNKFIDGHNQCSVITHAGVGLSAYKHTCLECAFRGDGSEFAEIAIRDGARGFSLDCEAVFKDEINFNVRCCSPVADFLSRHIVGVAPQLVQDVRFKGESIFSRMRLVVGTVLKYSSNARVEKIQLLA